MDFYNLVPNKKSTKGVRLLPKHRSLCNEYLANGLNASAAAKVLNYKNPNVIVHQIFARPEVRRYLEAELAKIEENQTIRIGEMLSKMRRLNDFNLMKYSRGSEGNSIIVNQEQYDEVSELIGDCVTKITTKTRTSKDGSEETIFELELMSKDKMFDRELKYLGILDLDGNATINMSVGGPVIDFDELARPPILNNVIEGRIEKGK